MNGFSVKSTAGGKFTVLWSDFLKVTGATLTLSALFLGWELGPGGTVALGASWSSTPSWATASNDDSSATNNHRRTNRSSNKTYGQQEETQHPAPFAPGSNNVSLHVGQIFLMGDLSSAYSDNIGAQVHYTYGVSDMFGFDTSLGYSQHSDGKYSVATFLTGLRTNLSWYDKVIPYLNFGLGFYKPSYQFSADDSLSPVLFGLYLGPGVDLQLTNQFFFGASLTFNDVFGTSRADKMGNLHDVGGTFTAFLLHAGVSF